MKCYYSNRDCKDCSKKNRCSILHTVLDLKMKVAKFLDKIEMRLEPPEKEEDF